MSTQLLYDAITLIDDDLIDEAADWAPARRKVVHWKRWTALAACLAVVLGAGGLMKLGLFGGMGGNSGSAGNAGSNAYAYDGTDDGSTEFMSYAGPVLPLTTLESADALDVQRELALDFAPWEKVWYSNEEHAAETVGTDSADYQEALDQYYEWYPEGGYYRTSTDLLVTDTYTLTNSTAEDQTFTALYPFVSSLIDLSSTVPTLTADGEAQEAELICGPYSGGFQGVLGADDPEGSSNLNQLTSWTDYKALLADGSYLEQALAAPADLSGTSAVVYEFTNVEGPARTDDIPNPSVRVWFDMDYDKTTVLSYGFHSGSYDPDAGEMGLGFSIREPDFRRYGQPYYLIVLGDDVENMEIEGYVTGGWDTEKKLDEFNVDVRRYETDLDTILRECVGYIYDNNEWQYSGSLGVDLETYYALFCDHLMAYGLLAEDGGAERYDRGWLSELSEVGAVDRVCYLKTEITVPAGASVTLAAQLRKPASFDYHCAHTENQGVYGYDAVTRLGSTLTFTRQTAELLDRGVIGIVRQNFGFDLAAGITSVTLDPAVEHYYLEVRRLPENDG